MGGVDREAGSPLISVIIPAYNAEDTIRAALQSVADQTVLHSERFIDSGGGIEVIVIDDASTDNTVSVVEDTRVEFGVRPIPLQLLKQQYNLGPAGARNAGIAVACGTWLAFLDADDAWIPLRLECQLEWLSKNVDTALVAAKVLQEDSPNANVPTDVARECGCKVLQLENFVDGNWVATSTVLVRRDAVIAAGGFDSRFRGPEDYDLWIRMAVNRRIVCLDCPLAYHHAGMDGLSGDDRTFLPEVLRVLEKAFGPGGALNQYSRSKHVAIARQYWHASWMAFNRGARWQAIVHLLRAFGFGYMTHSRLWHRGIGLLVRYLVGSPERTQS